MAFTLVSGPVGRMGQPQPVRVNQPAGWLLLDGGRLAGGSAHGQLLHQHLGACMTPAFCVHLHLGACMTPAFCVHLHLGMHSACTCTLTPASGPQDKHERAGHVLQGTTTRPFARLKTQFGNSLLAWHWLVSTSTQSSCPFVQTLPVHN